MNHTEFYSKLLALPNGANDVRYKEKRYLLQKQTLLEGKLLKIYAQELVPFTLSKPKFNEMSLP